MGKKDDIAAWDIGDGNAVLHFRERAIFRHGHVRRQGRATNGIQVDPQHKVTSTAPAFANCSRPSEFNRLALAVGKAEAVAGKTHGMGDGENGSGVEPSTQQNDSPGGVHGRIDGVGYLRENGIFPVIVIAWGWTSAW